MVALSGLIGVFKSLFFIAVGLCGIGFLIGFHELGHFLFCKLFGVRTPSFSIGMGPRLFSKRFWDTDFTLSLLPIGGYVEIAGAREVGQGDQKEAERNDEQSFAQKPYYQQLLILLGGIFFNLMFAYFAVSAVFFCGAPKVLLYPRFASATIESIAEQSSAQRADLQKGDTIIAYNDIKVQDNPTQFFKYIKEHPGQTVMLEINRNGVMVQVPVTLSEQEVGENKVGSLGAEFAMPTRSLLGSMKAGFKAVNEWIVEILRSMAQLFTKRDFKQMGGPLMIVSMTIKSAQSGFAIFLLLLAFISVNLAVLNVFPLPIFDGGQVLFYTIEAIIGRPLPAKVREYIHIACWILILVLIIAMSIQDVIRMIFG